MRFDTHVQNFRSVGLRNARTRANTSSLSSKWSHKWNEGANGLGVFAPPLPPLNVNAGADEGAAVEPKVKPPPVSSATFVLSLFVGVIGEMCDLTKGDFVCWEKREIFFLRTNASAKALGEHFFSFEQEMRQIAAWTQTNARGTLSVRGRVRERACDVHT